MAKKLTQKLKKTDTPGVYNIEMGRTKHDWGTIYENGYTYQYYYNRLKSIALVTYIYDFHDQVPQLESSRLEYMLLNYRDIAMFQTDAGDIAFLPYTIDNIKTIYGYPQYVNIYSPYSNFRCKREYEQVALLHDNITNYSTYNIISYFAMSLYIIDRTIDVNLFNQKTPVLITAKDEAQKLALKNMWMELSGFQPAVAVNDTYSMDSIQVMPINAPYIGEQLNELRESKWKQALSALGIPSTGAKKERYIGTELTQNIGEHVFSAYCRYIPRKEGIERGNQLFGCNIEFKYNDIVLDDSGFNNLFIDDDGGESNDYDNIRTNRWYVSRTDGTSRTDGRES